MRLDTCVSSCLASIESALKVELRFKATGLTCSILVNIS